MLTIVLLTLSVLLQLLSVVYALRLIKLTGRTYSWILISLAFFLMMVRGIIPLHYLIFKNPAYPIDLTGETIVLFLSFLMLLGMVGIKKIFIARNKVEEGTKRFATLIHYLSKYANDFIVLIDENFHFLEVNERVMDFCGYTHDELIEMNASQLRAPETKNEFINHIKIARIKGRTFYETFHQRKDKASSRWE